MASIKTMFSILMNDERFARDPEVVRFGGVKRLKTFIDIDIKALAELEKIDAQFKQQTEFLQMLLGIAQKHRLASEINYLSEVLEKYTNIYADLSASISRIKYFLLKQ